jgi:hypothetical protein
MTAASGNITSPKVRSSSGRATGRRTIAGTVKVKGRGGTILQPGIEILLNAKDFPDNAPILLITDGYCEDRLIFEGREHAFLIPEGARLPFVAKGKVFRMRM